MNNILIKSIFTFIIVFHNNSTNAQVTFPDSVVKVRHILGSRNEKGICISANASNIYGLTGYHILDVNGHQEDLGTTTSYNVAPGVDISFCQKIKLSNRFALSLEAGISFKNAHSV